MYTDYTFTYFSATSQVLQNDLNYVEQWLQENKLVLNQRQDKVDAIWNKTKIRTILRHCNTI